MAQSRFSRRALRVPSTSDVDVPATPRASIPVYIINRDRLTSTRLLIEWLLKAGTKKITILDNASSYPPLLEYYKSLPSGVECDVSTNLGPWAFWKRRLNEKQSVPYIVTDSDLVPSECCPLDLIDKLQELLLSVPGCEKVGPGLRLDNIPDLSRDFITNGDGKGWEGEGVYWKKRHASGAFIAPIDTTFAIYKAFAPWTDADWTGSVKNLRMDMPYVVEHTPWYTKKPFTEEEQYYRDHANHQWSHVTWPSPINS